MTQAIDRVRRALLEAGHADTIAMFAEGTHTAAEAAASVGCSVAQIAKSIIFRSGETPVLVVASGANRIDRAKVGRGQVAAIEADQHPRRGGVDHAGGARGALAIFHPAVV